MNMAAGHSSLRTLVSTAAASAAQRRSCEANITWLLLLLVLLLLCVGMGLLAGWQ
jgi:hypothetical protein